MNGNKKNMGSDIFGTGDAPETSPQKGGTQRNASNIFGTDDAASTPPTKSEDTKGNIFGESTGGASNGSVPAGKANPPTGTILCTS